MGKIEDAKVLPESECGFVRFLHENENRYRQFFADYEQYTYFMMLPLSHEQRLAIINDNLVVDTITTSSN